LSWEKATIDIGTKERQGLTFIALSHVKSIIGIFIDPPFYFDRYSRLCAKKYSAFWIKEEDSL
jgi:hypothetical protein